jgi:hypothetical protein
MSSLLPFLYLYLAWVPGLPIQLIGAEGRLSSNWGLLIGVLHSRMTRILDHNGFQQPLDQRYEIQEN